MATAKKSESKSSKPDPNHYNDAETDAAKAFIKNPVAGGAIPDAEGNDIVNGVTEGVEGVTPNEEVGTPQGV